MKQITIYILCIFVALSLCACLSTKEPPSIGTINNLYFDNKENIDTVVDFMANTEHKTILIDDSCETMYADFQTIEIPDHITKNAIKHLIDKGVIIAFYKDHEQIQLRVWERPQIRCWIAYSTNGTVPDVQYATESIAMEEAGWYYVIADYNEWRTQKTGDKGTDGSPVSTP